MLSFWEWPASGARAARCKCIAELCSAQQVGLRPLVHPLAICRNAQEAKVSPPEGGVSKSSPAKDGADKRRSTRLTLAVPVKVKGIDALHEPFTEQTRTVMVSCHGCRYVSRHYVTRGSEITLEIPRGIPDRPPRNVTAKVIWVQRPSHHREMLYIGLNLDVPGNVWDIPMPPEDWFPPPGEPVFVLEEPPPAPTPPAPPPPTPVTLTASWDASEILVMASRAEGHEAELEAALQSAKKEAATAVSVQVAEQVKFARPANDAPVSTSMEQALKAAIERLSETAVEKFVERASQRLAEVVEEARRAYDTATQEVDAKITKAVRDALSNENGNRHGRGRRRR